MRVLAGEVRVGDLVRNYSDRSWVEVLDVRESVLGAGVRWELSDGLWIESLGDVEVEVKRSA